MTTILAQFATKVGYVSPDSARDIIEGATSAIYRSFFCDVHESHTSTYDTNLPIFGLFTKIGLKVYDVPAQLIQPFCHLDPDPAFPTLQNPVQNLGLSNNPSLSSQIESSLACNLFSRPTHVELFVQ